MKILVTGAAGFVGSHMADALLSEGHSLVCVDDLSLGRKENLESAEKTGGKRFCFIKLDLVDKEALGKVFKENAFDAVFHLAANSDISTGVSDTSRDLEKTFMTTFNVLDSMRKYGVKKLVFSSSSAIYGENYGLLKEDSGPLMPVSFYGAAKLASEAYISAFSSCYGIQAWIIRFPNVVGERATHGAMYDFIRKLKENPKELTILGDGRQKKPYMYVKDVVGGIVYAWKNSKEKMNVYNLGVESSTTAARIAEMVAEEMGAKGVKFKYTGGDRGWVGDVPTFRYDISKIRELGWRPTKTSDEAVRHAVRAELGKA